ncbi:MAG: hypothetical protein LVR00_05395 [Rhabdochlamydiaceae bacterium]|jgi:hypothetical protein
MSKATDSLRALKAALHDEDPRVCRLALRDLAASQVSKEANDQEFEQVLKEFLAEKESLLKGLR